jgi:hypothetical protein
MKKKTLQVNLTKLDKKIKNQKGIRKRFTLSGVFSFREDDLRKEKNERK